MTPGVADATIFYSGVWNHEVALSYLDPSGPGSDFSRGIDLDLDGQADFAFLGGTSQLWVGADLAAIDPLVGAVAATPGGFEPLAQNFGSGSTVGASASWVQRGAVLDRFSSYSYDRSSCAISDNWGASDANDQIEGIAGVRHEGRYGWVRIRFDGNGYCRPHQATIVDWAYEDSGQPIAAGAIPEPTSGVTTGLGLLALGFRGVRARRRAA